VNPPGCSESDRMRAHENVRQLFTEAFAEELGVEVSDLRPQMLAGCVESAWGAARRAWLREEPKSTLRTH
jgi:hypothetical protein